MNDSVPQWTALLWQASDCLDSVTSHKMIKEMRREVKLSNMKAAVRLIEQAMELVRTDKDIDD